MQPRVPAMKRLSRGAARCGPLLAALAALACQPAVDPNAVSPPPGKGDGADNAPFCVPVPDRSSPDPVPSEAGGARCRWMDWNLSVDGFYVVSQFGTTADPTTRGRGTSCSALQTHYAAQCCLFDVERWECLDVDADGQQKRRKYDAPRGTGAEQCAVGDIPETGPPEVITATRTRSYWYTRRSIDFDYWTVIERVKRHYFAEDDALRPAVETPPFPHPEYFYVAGAQRFGCGAYLRVTNPANGRCIVVYADDGGPGSSFEGVWFAGRRILDVSPAVNAFLGVRGIGPVRGDTLFVEWAQPGDHPGQRCVPCTAIAARRGTEHYRSPFDLAHGFVGAASCRADSLKVGRGVHGGTPVTYIEGLALPPDAPDADLGTVTDGSR